MKLLKTAVSEDLPTLDGAVLHRRAARGIILDGIKILLLYTARYHDYTLPGGGVDDGENIEEGLIRELQEETGAQNIRNIKPLGLYEEFRPWYKDDADILHMESYCFTCDIDAQLGDPSLEDYETNNGMEAVWMNIFDAIEHNENTMMNSDKKGLSIERETFLLKHIADQFCLNKAGHSSTVN